MSISSPLSVLPPTVKVGIGVMIFKDGKVLLAQRKTSHGAGEYAFPGGHLEYGETFEACARREVSEECGIKIDGIEFLFVANVRAYTPKHYVHLTLSAQWKSGEPKIMEPDKSGPWAWYSLEDLPQPLFEFCTLSVQSYKNGCRYYDDM
ncbi:MAG: NUDIX hydrolase [Bdellovibrionales bacterium]